MDHRAAPGGGPGNQLLGYALLARPGQYAIDQVGLYLARYTVTVTWPLQALLDELTGRAPADLDQLRLDFAGVCQPFNDDDLAWLRE